MKSLKKQGEKNPITLSNQMLGVMVRATIGLAAFGFNGGLRLLAAVPQATKICPESVDHFKSAAGERCAVRLCIASECIFPILYEDGVNFSRQPHLPFVPLESISQWRGTQLTSGVQENQPGHNESIERANEDLFLGPQLKVRIFPHLKNYPPHGKDEIINSIRITPDGSHHSGAFRASHGASGSVTDEVTEVAEDADVAANLGDQSGDQSGDRSGEKLTTVTADESQETGGADEKNFNGFAKESAPKPAYESAYEPVHQVVTEEISAAAQAAGHEFMNSTGDRTVSGVVGKTRDLTQARARHKGGLIDGYIRGDENGHQDRASAGCRIYRGLTDRVGFIPGVVDQFHGARDFSVQQTDLPLWIDCPTPPLITRPNGQPGARYEGQFYLRAVQRDENTSMLEVINVVALELYLKGVVPEEIFYHWPEEALKTQSVAARTYALFHVLRNRRRRIPRWYDMDDTVAFQAYRGLFRERRETNEAILATALQVLTWAGERGQERSKKLVIQAFFSASAGGHTELASEAFGFKAPYTQSQAENFDAGLDLGPWDKTIDLKQLGAKLIAKDLLPSGAILLGLRLPEKFRNKSGRVKYVELQYRLDTIGTKPPMVKKNLADPSAGQKPVQSKRIKIRSFKKIISLKSTLMVIPPEVFGWSKEESVSIHPSEKKVLLTGKGWGHGVGVSQFGAMALSLEYEYGYQKILNQYYKNVALCQLELQTSSFIHIKCE